MTTETRPYVASIGDGAAEPYVSSYRRPSAANCWIDYENARRSAMRSRSQLVQAYMLAMAARCVNRVAEVMQVAA